MKFRSLLLAGLFTLSGGPAFAACEYNGTYYSAGSQLCFDGWLQECTVADYWKAVGMCHHQPDQMDPLAKEMGFSTVLFTRSLKESQSENATPIQAFAHLRKSLDAASFKQLEIRAH
ncbi:hypothetical protein [Labrenzia sp. DG1229]|uniref:hypothetical protein n=1 Tax=Labrenzia sp. DG1229 TaxID=681847 RepID=UPI000490C5A7|nr:hypothetical protein [Labrenzia sp. DG1229]